MRYNNIIALALLIAMSCQKVDPNVISANAAPEFKGTIETGLEVDLGLSAKWASCNVGATSPSQCGSYFSWGEAEEKSDYSESQHSLNGKLVNGQRLSKEQDAATSALGYGWRTPSPEDWQELIDNCTFCYASVGGQNGYVATSNVSGYEGTSIFFPCAGYKAEGNTNNVGVQALYWTDILVPDASTRAINAFFTEVIDGSELRLNAPPKGVGGLVWCGYPVRGIRKFMLDWDGTDINVDRNTTAVSINIYGNAKWMLGVNNGATCSQDSGEGDAQVTVSFPANDTYDQKTYTVTLSSPEFEQDESFTICQYGIVPDFYFSTSSAMSEWDQETVTFTLIATSDVVWSGAVKYSDGMVVEGASLNPQSGTGGSDIQVSLPSSTSIKEETVYVVELTTTDSRIPEDIRIIKAEIRQGVCPYAPYGTIWANSFMKAWNDAGFVANSSFTAENATASVSSSLSNPGKDNGYMKGKFKFSFTVAQTGTGVFGFWATLATTTQSYKVTATRNGDEVFSQNYAPGNLQKTFVECEMDLKKGDVVTLQYNNTSSNAKLYCGAASPITWNKKN